MKEIYKVFIETTLTTNKYKITEQSDVEYRLLSKEEILKYYQDIDCTYNDYSALLNKLKSDRGYISKNFIYSESIFGKPRITHYDKFKQPLHIKQKQFVSLSIILHISRCNLTTNECQQHLYIDEYIQYCLDRGIQVIAERGCSI